MEATRERAADERADIELAHLAADLRLACMRISRRVRFESSHDVPPHHFSVLVRLDRGPATPGELAEFEKVTKPSMSRTVAALVERGLITRTPDPHDGRQVILTLTAAGRQTLDRTRARRDAWMVTRMARLDPAEVEVLARAEAILARVAAE